MLEAPYRQILIFVVSALVIAALRRLWIRMTSDPVVAFEQDDPVYLAAVEQARTSLEEFWAGVRSCKDPDAVFGLKVAFKVGSGVEHVWLAVNEHSELARRGTLMNRPQHIDKREGDVVAYEEDQITDWYIRTHEGTKGGYSIRAMIQKLPPKRARAMAESHGLTVT